MHKKYQKLLDAGRQALSPVEFEQFNKNVKMWERNRNIREDFQQLRQSNTIEDTCYKLSEIYCTSPQNIERIAYQTT